MSAIDLPESVRSRTVWPLPALLTWALAWAFFIALHRAGAAAWLALALPTALGAALAALGGTRSRRLIVAGGFPLSVLACGAATGLPAWAWLAPLAILALAYPVRAWRDAPLFPTPPDALRGLDRIAALAAGARVLDAGCGLGHGLQALRRVYPQARIDGIEWSRPWALLARLRCRFARVRRGDMWAVDWSGYALVYLFQRPESMARALAKAQRELAPGGWLVSLEFPACGVDPHGVLHAEGERPVWIYRIEAAHAATTPSRQAAHMIVSSSSNAGARR